MQNYIIINIIYVTSKDLCYFCLIGDIPFDFDGLLGGKKVNQ